MPFFHLKVVILQAESEKEENHKNNKTKIKLIKWQQLEKSEAGDLGW